MKTIIITIQLLLICCIAFLYAKEYETCECTETTITTGSPITIYNSITRRTFTIRAVNKENFESLGNRKHKTNRGDVVVITKCK